MPHIYWYICLAFIGIGPSLYIIINKRKNYKISTLIMFYICIAGFSWVCEFLVLGLFDAYKYNIGVFGNKWEQNLLAHLILNTSLYPSAALITVTRKRRILAIFIYCAFFTVADCVFEQLGLYVHHWWRCYMTTITVVVILIISLIWFDKIKHGCQGWLRVVTYFFIALIIVHTPAPILLLLEKQYYQLSVINNFYGDRYLSSIIVIFSYHCLECFILVFVACILKKWYLKLLPFVISITAQYLFLKLNILVLQNGWKLIFTLFLYEVCIALFLLLEKNTLIKSKS